MQKATLITGCSTGIGRAFAQEFRRRGQLVYATARRVETLRELEGEGIRAAALDVTDAASIAALMQRLQHDGVAVDLLVNNAGYGAIGPLAEMPLDEVRQQFETNVIGVVAMIQAIVPGMITLGGGRIVNIGSVSGILATPFGGAYSASKAAVHLLTDALRMELAPFGIRMITVQPGGIRSEFAATAGKGAGARSAKLSIYAPIADAIQERTGMSQMKATPTDVFARDVADAVLAANPRFEIRLGSMSSVVPSIKRWVPTRIADRLLSRRFKLDRLRPSRK